MKLVLDTHILVWFATDPSKLSARERGLIEAGDAALLVSALSIFELRMKWGEAARPRRDEVRLDPREALTFLERADIVVAPITGTDFASVLKPWLAHRDPFDEMLLTHAQQLGARLLTRDGRLAGHPAALLA